MTYGFKFLNNNSETVIDDSNVKPWFWGEAPPLSTTDITSTYNLLNQNDGTNSFSSFVAEAGVVSWTVYKINYQAPAAYDCFIMLKMPNSNQKIFYSCPNPVSLTGNTLVEVYAFAPNTAIATSADIPKAYVFVGNPIPNALKSSGYGIQVFDQSNQCMFDSGKRHLQPAQFPTILINHLYQKYNLNYPSGYTTPYGYLLLDSNYTIPSNPAWLLPSSDILWVYPEGSTWYATHNEIMYKKIYNQADILTAQPQTYKTITQPSNPAGLFGNSYLYANRLPGSAGDEYAGVPSIVVDATPLDQGYTGPEFPTTYTLSRDKSGVTENTPANTASTIAISLTTTAVPNGTVLPYTITGISAADLATNTLTGSFVVSNNNSTIYLSAVADALAEGTETATLSLNNGRATISFTISDAISYSLSSFMTPEEGQSIAVTLTTAGLANGSTVPYTITGITQADLTVGTITGNFTISSNTSGLEFRFARDASTENETMRISVNNGNTFLDIAITDVPPGNEVLTISPNSITTTQTTNVTITGGAPNTSFEFITLAQGVDPVYAWNNRWLPQYASQVGTLYFDENGEYYNNPLGSGFGTGNRTLWIFTNYTKNFRSANITVSLPPTFSITGSDGTKGPLSIAEGSIGYFKVTTTNLPTGTVVYPKFINTDLDTNDYTNSAASGVAVDSNGIANFTISFTADQSTEGSQSGELVVQYPNNTTKDSYGVITVLDTSLTAASYSLTKTVPSGTTANEGTAAYFYLTTNQSANLYWVLEGTGITADDIQAAGAYDADGNYYSYGANLYGIINTTYYMLSVLFKNDVKTEGNETLIVSIKTGSQNGQTVASSSVIIGDTSLYPAAGTPTGNPYCIGVNRYQNYHDGSGGQYSSVIEYNSTICGYVPPASYSVSRYVATVDENGFQFFTIGLTSVPSGTQLWWDISGTNITTNDIQYVYHDAQDGNGWFTPSGGSTLNNTFTVYGQTSYQVIIYPRSDLQTEGTETATFNLRTGYSGGPSVANTSFNINDTSTTPSYNESLTIVSDANGNHIVPLNGYMTISITGGAPNTGFTFAITNNGDPQPSSFPGAASLDGGGNFTNYITGATFQGSQTVGDKRLWVKFNFNNNVRSARANIVYDAGTLSGGQYCVGYTLTQNYNDGVGGVYSQVVEYNNVATCGYVQQYTPARTRVYYTYYNYDYMGDTWGLDSGRPGGAVTGTIVDGPYAGFAISGTFNGSGQFRYPVGNYGYLSPGFYTINFTFPGQDVYYSASYRTIVAYFYVRDASAGAGGVLP